MTTTTSRKCIPAAGCVFLAALAWATPLAGTPPGDEDPAEDRSTRLHTFAVDIVLTTGPTFRNGLGVAIAFDGRELRFERFESLEANGLLGASRAAELDDLDVDGDERTDRLVRLAWLLPGDGWETPGQEVALGRAVFRRRAPVPPFAWPDAPVVAVTSLSADRKGWFPDRLVTLTAAQQTVCISEEEEAGAARTGLANDRGSRPFTLGRFQAHRPRELTMATGTIFPCNLDVDGNSLRDALTDGLLLHRYLFGFMGTALVSDALGTGATRTDGASVAAFLAQPDCQPMLDVDGNASPDALTDGLLTVRYLFGFTGESLVTGATGTGAGRISGPEVASFLEYCDNPREAAIQATLFAGQTATDVWGEIQVSPVDTQMTLTVVAGTNDEGERTVEVRSDVAAALALTLPDANDTLPPAARTPGDGRLSSEARRAGFRAAHSEPFIWGTVDRKWFGGRTWLNRLPPSKQRFFVLPACMWQVFPPLFLPLPTFAHERSSTRLRSLCAESDAACYQGKEPVLFVHGFNVDWFNLGGWIGDDIGTFVEFPRLVQELPGGQYASFLFEWSSSARFSDVAADLGAAVNRVAQATGKKVHVVGHSMGGVLARVLLQGLATGDQTPARSQVRTLTTLGAPHSGIADGTLCLHNVGLPGGQDSQALGIFEVCQQVSCHELGEDTLDDTCEPAFFEVDVQEGGIAAALSDTVESLPQLDALILLGWTMEDTAVLPDLYASGDGLITYGGQRFLPNQTVEGACPSVTPKAPDALLSLPGNPVAQYGAAKVTERALGLGIANPIPGISTPFGCVFNAGVLSGCEAWQVGYGHSSFSRGRATAVEASVACATPATCSHHGFTATRDWLAANPSAPGTVQVFTVSVRAEDGVTSTAVQGAAVRVEDAAGGSLGSGTTGADGAASVTVPFAASASFAASLTKDGYQQESRPFSTGASPATVDLGTVRMYQRLTGSLGGTVTSSAGGAALSGAAYSLQGIENPAVARSGTANGSGAYLEQNLPSGSYDATFSASGYTQLQTTFVVAPGVTTTGNAALTPTGAGNEITVTLPGLPVGAKPLVLVRIPAGTFQMGSPTSDLNRDPDEVLHDVTLTQDYYMGKYEVTQAQWLAVMGTSHYCSGYGDGNDYPVYCVSWNDIAGPSGFLEKLRTITGDTRFRLPTEAEWERAARGGTQTRFSFGDALDSDDNCGASAAADPYVWWCANSGSVSHAVGTKGANQYGLFDMHGNEYEWVQDFYGAYTIPAPPDPTGPATGPSRVLRGGGFGFYLWYSRSAARSNNCLPDCRFNNGGFRLARSV